MEKSEARPKRFIGTFSLGDSITITIEYEYPELIRHLRDRSIVRIFRSVDRRNGNITFDEERAEFAQKLVVMKRDVVPEDFLGQPEAFSIAWSTNGLDEAVKEIIAIRVLPDEKETYPDLITQQATEKMEPAMRANLITGIIHLLLRSLDDAVLSRLERYLRMWMTI